MQELIKLLAHKDKRVRSIACLLLGLLGKQDAISALITACQDKQSAVRCQAALALGQLGDKEVIPHLIHILKDRNAFVRAAAAEALVKIGKPAVAPLLQALKDKDKEVRYYVVWILRRIGDKRAISYLEKVAQEDIDSGVRQAAKEALRNARVD